MAIADQIDALLDKTNNPIDREYLLFVGGGFYANRSGISWFAKQVAPELSITICVVGHGLDDLREDLERHPNIQLIGAVDDLAPWYRGAKAVIAPIFVGSGMKTKVAEALMHGKRIIGTSEAFVGYEEVAEHVGWNCNTKEEFITVIRQIEDAAIPPFEPELRFLYERHFSLEAAKTRLEAILGCSYLLPALVRRGAHVADIGGNRGSYAYRLWKLGARLEVFEPNPLCARVLQTWAGGASGVNVHPVALSSGEGSATLHIPVDDHGIEHDASASIHRHSGGSYHDVEVPLRSLDSFGFVNLDFIKIDTEGHEACVIAGATATLQTSQPAMLIEIEQRHHPEQPISAIFDRMTDLGYRGFFLRDGRLQSIEYFDLDRDQAPASFTVNDATYLNNFLFLSGARLKAGDYVSLARRWMAS
jgi:FkbM family methyltransferase